MIRFVTYLAPSLPAALFEEIARHVGEVTGEEIALRFETGTSGPCPDGLDPFTAGDAEVGFVCAPTFQWLAERRPPPVELLGVAPRFADPRAAGRPVYFADVIVAAGHPARSFAELRGASWGYNDPCSLSGYLCLLDELAASGNDLDFLAELRQLGSHLECIAHVARGAVDAAAIDSNVLALALRRDPSLGRTLRVVTSWGPYPIQPVIVSRRLDPAVRARVRAALLAAGDRFAAHGVDGFAVVDAGDYGLTSSAGTPRAPARSAPAP